jgi:hypothetical protein
MDWFCLSLCIGMVILGMLELGEEMNWDRIVDRCAVVFIVLGGLTGLVGLTAIGNVFFMCGWPTFIGFISVVLAVFVYVFWGFK